ncbi:MAG: copper chaperone, partial [Kribbellaceae bacterium]|nr:copper chaperone [Kribbellaceae bacterium]
MSADTARSSVARLLSALAFDVFDRRAVVAPLSLRYQLEPVSGLLTEEFLRTKLEGCPPGLVTAATHRVTWTDSTGVSNVAHAGALGAVVPIVAREATLAVWRGLDDSLLAERTTSLSPADTALLAEVTTDKEPLAILRTGVDAAARVLVQHAYLAARTPYDDSAAFAAVLRDSGLFATVAGTWYWGLQAATYRRGLIPAQLICFGGRVNYSADTVAALRAMKELRIAD